jgi:eukaryotic-like serine/threonine-protein kinase
VAVTRLPQWSQPLVALVPPQPEAAVAALVPPQPEAAVAVAVQPTPRSSSVLTSQVSVVNEPAGQGKQPAVDALLDVVATRPARKQTPTASTKPGRRSTRDATGAASPGPGPVAQCSPPTFTDADGIRHFKMECL